MKRLVVFAFLLILGGACSTDSDVDVAEGPLVEDAGLEEAASNSTEKPTSVPGTIPETPLPLREPAAPVPAPIEEQPQYLLTAKDLRGWQYTRSMNFSAEPTFESSDCDLMNQAWGAHAQPGRRVRAGSDEVNLRQAVVEMPDTASAIAVLDAADQVWRECAQLDVDGDTWWIEPVEMPEVGEWRSGGIAIGVSDSMWIIGYWQLDDRIVFVDIDGDDPWDAVNSVAQAVAGRLIGIPAPAQAPTSDLPVLVDPNPPTEPLSTPSPLPTIAPRTEWADDVLAALVPEPAEIGAEWRLVSGGIVSAEPGGEQEIPGCDIPSPATPAGIEVTFEQDPGFEVIELQLLSGTAEEASGWPSSFRALVGCDLSESGFEAMVEVPSDVEGADDAVVLVAELSLGDLADFVDTPVPTHAFFAVARFDGLVVGLLWVAEQDAVSIDDVTEIIEMISSKR